MYQVSNCGLIQIMTGKAAVDYIITPHDHPEFCIDFNVIAAFKLTDSCGVSCIELIGERFVLPDHSVLMFEIKVGFYLRKKTYHLCKQKDNIGPSLITLYLLICMPLHFWNLSENLKLVKVKRAVLTTGIITFGTSLP